MSRIRRWALALVGVGGFVAFACGGGSAGTGEALASDQTLNFAILDDVSTLDPGHVSGGVDSSLRRMGLGPAWYGKLATVLASRR